VLWGDDEPDLGGGLDVAWLVSVMVVDVGV
jgi:hypothetical protein